jgi:hypothetical protein
MQSAKLYWPSDVESKVNWAHVDRLLSAGAIASYLHQLGARGDRGTSLSCPLAGNGWRILRSKRYRVENGKLIEVPLTEAEQEFVRLFDNGAFPELAIE